jgi:hypothetical protein
LKKEETMSEITLIQALSLYHSLQLNLQLKPKPKGLPLKRLKLYGLQIYQLQLNLQLKPKPKGLPL